MGKRVGIWDTSTTVIFDYTVVRHEDYEYYEVFKSDFIEPQGKVFKLKPSVKRNPEIFAWYLTCADGGEFEFDSNCCDSAAGHLIFLLQEFMQAFNRLDVEVCQRVRQSCSRTKLQNYYLYRVEPLLDELTTYADILRLAFLNSAPIDLKSQTDYETWWRQPLIIQQRINQFSAQCDLNFLEQINSLKPLVDFHNRLKKGAGQWAALRGLEGLEGASGYLLALAHYWFRSGNYQASLLLIHRSVDCVLTLLAYRGRLVNPTVSHLQYSDNTNDLVSFYNTFKRLTRGGNNAFDEADKRFIQKLNLCRNYLRETHGFRVVRKEEVHDSLISADRLLSNLTPDVKSYSYKEKFSFDFQIPLKLIFEVEVDIDSYIDHPK